MVRGQFAISVGFDGWLVKCITSGWNPETAWDVLTHAVFLGPLRIVAAVYTAMHYRIVNTTKAKTE
jgi:hypothetical protein